MFWKIRVCQSMSFAIKTSNVIANIFNIILLSVVLLVVYRLYIFKYGWNVYIH